MISILSVFASSFLMAPRSKVSPVDLRLAYPLGASFSSSGTRKVWLEIRAGAQAASASAAMGMRNMGSGPPREQRGGSTGGCRACIGHLPLHEGRLTGGGGAANLMARGHPPDPPPSAGHPTRRGGEPARGA